MNDSAFILRLLAREVIRVDADAGMVFGPRSPAKPIGYLSPSGYLLTTFQQDGVCKRPRVHRIVWISVNGAIPDELMIDHINRAKTDNRIANLRLVDSKGNNENKDQLVGERNPRSKISDETARLIRRELDALTCWRKAAYVAKKLGVSVEIVRNIRHGRRIGQ